jgi:glycosyltransferase involved in cell wall biosynthesis
VRVTVVIPAYNAGPFIEEAVSSCRLQDIRSEVIVVDDGSTDNTADIARRSGARVMSFVRNMGAAQALKTGFSYAETEYIAWLSADDMFVTHDKLSRQVAAMDRSGSDFSYYSQFLSGTTLGRSSVTKSPLDFLVKRGFAFWAVFPGVWNPINGSTLMFRGSSMKRFGTFDPSLGNVDADGELVLRWLKAGARLERLEGVGVFYRIHQAQTSKDRLKMAKGMLTTRLMVALS